MKENNKNNEKQPRKKYNAAGERGQKMMAFRLDLDLEGWLNKQANKGRYINDLIRKARAAAIAANWEKENDPDEMPTAIDDYQP